MEAIAFGHGKDMAVKLDNVSGSLVDISAYVSSATFSYEGEVADVSVLGAVGHTFVRGLTNGNVSFEGPFDPFIGTLLFNLGTAGATQSFEVHPQGTASGKQKYSGECRLTSYEVPGGIEDAVTWSAEFQIDGAVTVANN